MRELAKEWKIVVPLILLAIWMGSLIADGSYLVPAAVAGGVFLVMAMRYIALDLNVLICGALIFGYMVGNRGFAQLTPAASLPLFPAEIGLGIASLLLIWKGAKLGRVPIERDPINYCILMWIAVSSTRIPFDLRAHGFSALRDFALIYYALYFFIAQDVPANALVRRWFMGCFLLGSSILLPLSFLYSAFPNFFLTTLTIRGIPLIFIKGDLAGIFMSVGALFWFQRHQSSPRSKWLPLILSQALVVAMMATDNRASMIGLLTATLLLGFCGRWTFARTLLITGALSVIILASWAFLSGREIKQTPLHGVYERVISVVDVSGSGSYSATGAENKGDNNRFRAVWWRTVFSDTVAANPWVGLGFGYDLSENFLKIYYPDSNDDFTARSPHNVLLTVFARTGLAGLSVFIVLIFAIFQRTLRAIQAAPVFSENALFWCSGCIILTSATLGVVLEGPMGAVLFWILLGLANQGVDSKETSDNIDPPVSDNRRAFSAAGPSSL